MPTRRAFQLKILLGALFILAAFYTPGNGAQ